MHPFTYDEPYGAYRLFADEATAAEMARASTAEERELGPLHTGSGLDFRSIAEISFTDDTLILLSLATEALDTRVSAYRSRCWAGQVEPPAVAAAWAARRKEVELWKIDLSPMDDGEGDLSEHRSK